MWRSTRRREVTLTFLSWKTSYSFVNISLICCNVRNTWFDIDLYSSWRPGGKPFRYWCHLPCWSTIYKSNPWISWISKLLFVATLATCGCRIFASKSQSHILFWQIPSLLITSFDRRLSAERTRETLACWRRWSTPGWPGTAPLLVKCEHFEKWITWRRKGKGLLLWRKRWRSFIEKVMDSRMIGAKLAVKFVNTIRKKVERYRKEKKSCHRGYESIEGDNFAGRIMLWIEPANGLTS